MLSYTFPHCHYQWNLVKTVSGSGNYMFLTMFVIFSHFSKINSISPVDHTFLTGVFPSFCSVWFKLITSFHTIFNCHVTCNANTQKFHILTETVRYEQLQIQDPGPSCKKNWISLSVLCSWLDSNQINMVMMTKHFVYQCTNPVHWETLCIWHFWMKAFWADVSPSRHFLSWPELGVLHH